MFSLNKTIYYLILGLLLEVSVFGVYVIIENFSDTKKLKPKVLNVEVLREENVKEETLKIISYVQTKATIKTVELLQNSSESETLVPKMRRLNPSVPSDAISLLPKQVKVKSLEDVVVHLKPHSELDIVSIQNQMVKPIIYTKSVKLSDLSIEDKKKTFIDMLIPSILVAKHRMRVERKKVAKLLGIKKLSSKDALWVAKKRYIFKASSIGELHDKMELHPTSIVIAQAIIESGWGTSRFFEKANNVFGIWSFNPNDKRIAASEKRGKKTVFLKKYTSVEQSISDYFLMLSTKDVYKTFREKRLESQDPFVLIKELGKYSELGDEYIENLKNTIEKNKLLEYDSYSLDI